MLRNLFQLNSYFPSSHEKNSGAKIIQFSDHKHKFDHKKLKIANSKDHIDPIVKSYKNHSKYNENKHYSDKLLFGIKKNLNIKTTASYILYYTFNFIGIVLGLFLLFGGASLMSKYLLLLIKFL